MEKELSIDEQLYKLEDILKTMESDEISLEDALLKFEEGVKLVRETEKALSGMEQKLKILTEGEPEDDI